MVLGNRKFLCTGICGKVKDKSEFNKDNSRKQGITTRCKECLRIPPKFIVKRKEEIDLRNMFNTRKVVGSS